MFKQMSTQLATIACTILLSTTCVLSAVGPASANGERAVASAARMMA